MIPYNLKYKVKKKVFFMDESKKRIPTIEELEKEINRVKHKERLKKYIRGMCYALITVAAAAVLVAVLFLPILRIHGSSMTPTLQDGEIVLSIKSAELERGDIIAFYYNNKVLVKRLIAKPGEWVDIDEHGNVKVNGALIEEPYIDQKALGECDIELPYQVPDRMYFVMGDHRSVSVDSRSSTVGCIAEKKIVGKLVFKIWPFSEFGAVQ